MEISRANLTTLAQQLSQSTDRQLTKVVGLIDKLSDRGTLDAAISQVRDRLATLRPARPLSLARLLFNPVEDLLDNDDVYRRQSRRVNRALIRTVTQLVEQALGPEAETLRTRLADKTTHDEALAFQMGCLVWPRSAQALEAVLARAARDPAFRVATLGRNLDVADQIQDLIIFLKAAAEIEELKVNLPPRPFGTLALQHIAALEKTFTAIDTAEAIDAIARVLIARASRPGELMATIDALCARLSATQARLLTTAITAAAVAAFDRDLQGLAQRTARTAPQNADIAERLLSFLVSLDRQKLGGNFRVGSATLVDARHFIAAFLSPAVAEGVAEAIALLAALPRGEAGNDAAIERLERTLIAVRVLADIDRTVRGDRKAEGQIDRLISDLTVRARDHISEAAARDADTACALAGDFCRMIELVKDSEFAEPLWRNWMTELNRL
ncbi:MAG: hypothetical protein P4M00_02365 [Azospirillaceae bacterium]|nr:hypothetical protein [Azospirillaceae bacterium]